MPNDMSPEEFRRFGHQAVDWMADYLAGIRERPVMPATAPGDLVRSLPQSAPDAGQPMGDILSDFDALVMPHVNHWNHPRFFGYFSVSASAPGILAEMIAASLNVNAMLWKSCPAATELEQVTMDWLRQWIDLPEQWFGMIHDTASLSTLHSIAAAREFRFPEVRLEGGLRDAIVYTSEQAHSSIEKGAIALGVGQSNVRKIAVDAEFRMRPDVLRSTIAADRAAGKQPFYVCASIGTTSTSSADPVNEIASICESEKLWLHIDASYAGPLAMLPEMRHYFAGCERADSFVLNPHKWLFTPIDISVLYTKRPDVMRRAFSLVPEYLRSAQDTSVVNYMDYGVALGRRFRALKLWFVMRYFGREGVETILREHLRIAGLLAQWVEADSRFELAAPVPFSLVCFRLKQSNAASEKLMHMVNDSGRAFISHTVLNGSFVLRLAIGDVKTTEVDVAETWKLIQELA